MLFQGVPQLSEIGDGTGKPVQTVDNDFLYHPLLHVLHHALKVGAVGVLARKAFVLIDTDLFSCLPPAQVNLPLDGEAVRLVHGLTGVDRVQDGHLPSLRQVSVDEWFS